MNPPRAGGAIMAFETENITYQSHLLELLPHSEGKYLAIRGTDLRGPHESYEDALRAGYEAFGLVPFLVRPITRHDPELYFTRDLPLCQP